jgi:hypothetical protein
MQNFGRGMWRRVGDYERLNSYSDIQLQHHSAFIEYQKFKQRQEAVNKYREHMLKQANSNPSIVTSLIKEEIPDYKPNTKIIAAVEPDVFSQNITEELDNYLEDIEVIVEPIVEPILDPIVESIVEPIVEPIVNKEQQTKTKNKGKKSKK